MIVRDLDRRPSVQQDPQEGFLAVSTNHMHERFSERIAWIQGDAASNDLTERLEFVLANQLEQVNVVTGFLEFGRFLVVFSVQGFVSNNGVASLCQPRVEIVLEKAIMRNSRDLGRRSKESEFGGRARKK